MVRPIQTFYQGYHFRSRLEARWAVFFTTLGITWEYEPEGYVLDDGTAYLPDFWLPQVRMFAEVKPATPPGALVDIGPEAMRKAVGLVLATKRPLIILDGVPTLTNYWALWPDEMLGWCWDDVVISEGHRYWETEGRFYTSSGAGDRRHDPAIADWWPCPGVAAARAARFERTH